MPRAIAAELDARGIVTRRNRRWQVSNVRNLLGRIAQYDDRGASWE